MTIPPPFLKGLVFPVQFCFLYLKEPWAALHGSMETNKLLWAMPGSFMPL